MTAPTITSQSELRERLAARWRTVRGTPQRRGAFAWSLNDGTPVLARVVECLRDAGQLVVAGDPPDRPPLDGWTLRLACRGVPDEDDHLSTPWCYRDDGGRFHEHE